MFSPFKLILLLCSTESTLAQAIIIPFGTPSMVIVNFKNLKSDDVFIGGKTHKCQTPGEFESEQKLLGRNSTTYKMVLKRISGETGNNQMWNGYADSKALGKKGSLSKSCTDANVPSYQQFVIIQRDRSGKKEILNCRMKIAKWVDGRELSCEANSCIAYEENTKKSIVVESKVERCQEYDMDKRMIIDEYNLVIKDDVE